MTGNGSIVGQKSSALDASEIQFARFTLICVQRRCQPSDSEVDKMSDAMQEFQTVQKPSNVMLM